MTLRFTSGRERRLWLSTLAIVAAIYSTLGLAGSLADVLDNRDLTTVSFAVGILLIGVTVVTQGLRTKTSGAEIGVALGVVVVYLMVLLRMALAERSHLIEYGVVASFIYEALKERAGQGSRVPVPGVLAVLATGAVGVLDEGIQLFLYTHAVQYPGRNDGSAGAGGAGPGQASKGFHPAGSIPSSTGCVGRKRATSLILWRHGYSFGLAASGGDRGSGWLGVGGRQRPGGGGRNHFRL